jgi:carbon monoxide dehydrogenase subunit G
LQAEGDAGRLGQAQAKIDIHLHPLAQGTRLTWSALPRLQGQLAQVGQRLTQISAKRVRNFLFVCLQCWAVRLRNLYASGDCPVWPSRFVVGGIV